MEGVRGQERKKGVGGEGRITNENEKADKREEKREQREEERMRRRIEGKTCGRGGGGGERKLGGGRAYVPRGELL